MAGNGWWMQALTHPGLARSSNEDATLAEVLADGSRMLVVADGVGGVRGGEVASAQALDGFAAHLREGAQDDPERALRDAFAAANARVREAAAAGDPALASMSTTLVAGLVRDRSAWLANVGDSRGYLVQNSRAERLTQDHSWVDEEIRGGRLSPDDPLVQSYKNLITRVVGGGETVEVDTYGPIELAPGSALLFCSDGLHGAVPDEEIADAFAGPKEEACERLIQLALDAGGPDNVSVAVLWLTSEAPTH